MTMSQVGGRGVGVVTMSQVGGRGAGVVTRSHVHVLGGRGVL